MIQPIAHGLVFGGTFLAVMVACRLIAPPPYQSLGLGRFSFLRLHVTTFAQFAVIPTLLYVGGSVAVGVSWPQWLSAALAAVFALAGFLFAPAAGSLARAVPSADVGASIALRVLSSCLPLTSVFLPYVAKWLAPQFGA